MAFKRFATKEDFCKECSPYKVGDTVTLIRDISLEEGVLEAGSVVTIADVRLRRNVTIPHAYAEEVKNYKASEECFEYALEFCKERIDYFWLGRVFEKGLLKGEMITEAYARKTEAEAVIAKRQKKKVSLLLYPATILITAVVVGLFLYIKNQGLTTGEKIVTGALMALVPLGAYACIWEKLDEWAWTEVHQFALKTRKEINEGM